MFSIIWVLFVLLALAAAASDALTFRIPNVIIVGLLVLFVVAVALASTKKIPIPWANHIGAGALSLAVGLLLYGVGQMGAGDAKLLAVVALWAGLSKLILLLFALAVTGVGALLAILILRRLLGWLNRNKPDWKKSELPRVLRTGEGIPYGVAIVLGTVFVAGGFPHWLWSF